MPTGKAVKKPAPIGLQIDALFKLREELQARQAKVTEQEEKIAAATEVLMKTMEELGVEKTSGKLATVSISETVTGNVKDWDAFLAYVYKNKYGHLLQRRVSDPAIRELFEKNRAIPGVEPFTKKRLNLRKAT